MLRLRKDAKVGLLSRVPLFEGLSKVDLRKVAGIADELDLPAGKTLTREGERGRELFVLLEGEAVVRRRGRRLATLRAGDVVGEIALLADVPRTATVVTGTAARALVITDRDFRRLLRDSPTIAVKLLGTVAQRAAAAAGGASP